MNYLGFSESTMAPVGRTLNQLLANYQVYYQNLRNFHWNVSGENFFDLHAKFEELYVDAREKIDELAERILTIRLRPLSTLSGYLKTATVREAGEVLGDRDMVAAILDNHRIIITSMRKVLDAAGEVGDEGTIDLVGGMLSEFEKNTWMLDAWFLNKIYVRPAEVN